MGAHGADGVRFEVSEATPSTNAIASERARDGAAEGLVVVTEHQTAGRGRRDRSWETPAGAALTFSVVLRPNLPAGMWPWLPLVTGYAVTKTLIGAGYPAGVKWPNDVLITSEETGEDRKVAGILVERVEAGDGPAAVVGIGLNTGLSAAELPVATATSLLIESGVEPDRTDLLLTLVATLLETYQTWQLGGPPGHERLAASYAATCVTLGRAVRVELPGDRTLVGTATGIDTGGRLVVAGPDGPTPVGAGDVVHVRPVAG